MSSLENLYKIRQEKGKKRQKRHEELLDELHDKIQPLLHPYAVEEKERDRFYASLRTARDEEGNAAYYSGSKGYEAKVDSTYIYRITTAYQLATRFQADWIFTEINLSIENREFVFNERFLEEVAKYEDWIPLSLVAKGNLKYPRNFSFWTSHEYDRNDILVESFRAGLASDWFDRLIVVLRCDIEDAKELKICVPTVIDAYDQPIFHPTEENEASPPIFGTAININETPLCLGYPEFVVGEISVDKIKFIPCKLERIGISRIEFKNNYDLWAKLDNYYQDL